MDFSSSSLTPISENVNTHIEESDDDEVFYKVGGGFISNDQTFLTDENCLNLSNPNPRITVTTIKKDVNVLNSASTQVVLTPKQQTTEAANNAVEEDTWFSPVEEDTVASAEKIPDRGLLALESKADERVLTPNSKAIEDMQTKIDQFSQLLKDVDDEQIGLSAMPLSLGKSRNLSTPSTGY